MRSTAAARSNIQFQKDCAMSTVKKFNPVFGLVNIKFGIQPISKVASCADEMSSRYVLNTVAVIPSDKPDHVLCAATDSRKMTVVECPGKTTERIEFIPKEVIPAPKGQDAKNSAVVYQAPALPNTSGSYITDRGGKEVGKDRRINEEAMRKKLKPNPKDPEDKNRMEPDRSRYPNVVDVFPNIEQLKDYTVIRFDAEFLLRIAEAINPTDGIRRDAVTLFIPNEKVDESAIPVLGEVGMGLLMPMSWSAPADKRDDKEFRTEETERKELERRITQLKKQWKKIEKTNTGMNE